MSVLKNKLAKKYSQLPNELVTDKRLSHGAFRVCAYLFTKPDNWVVYNKDIQNSLNIGQPQTLANYWKELEQAGWITRRRQKNEEGKYSGGFDYILNVDNPQYGKSLIRENPTLGKIHNHSNTDLKSNTNKDTNIDFNAREEKIGNSKKVESSKSKGPDQEEKDSAQKEKIESMYFDPDNFIDAEHQFLNKAIAAIWKEKFPNWMGRGVYEYDYYIRIGKDIGRYLIGKKGGSDVTLLDICKTFRKMIDNPPHFMDVQTPKGMYNNLNLYIQQLENKNNDKGKRKANRRNDKPGRRVSNFPREQYSQLRKIDS